MFATAMTQEHTHYQILGVSPNASHAEIKAAYRRVLLSKHPDKSPLSPKYPDHSGSFDIARIQDAYRILSDGTARAAYDASISGTLSKSETYKIPGPRPAQLVSLEEFTLMECDDEGMARWTHTCRCGGLYSISEQEMLDNRHLIACEQCSEIVYVGYDVLEEGDE